MDSSAVTVKKEELGRLKAIRQFLLRRHEHKLLIFCLVGLYSCRWRRRKVKGAAGRGSQIRKVQPGEWCCSKRECAFFPVLVAALCSSLVFLYLWGEGKNDYNNFDWFSYTNLGFWFLWSVLLLALAAISFSYVLLLVVLAMFLVSERQHLYLHYFHKFTAPFLHVIALICMVLLSWPVALSTFRLNKKVLQVSALAPYLALLLFLFFIPLGMYSPCIRENGTLGPKPALIGHRGASMVAPENTLMSFEKTIEHYGDGLETDVRISTDGVPFLMHDDTLTRTTDIQEAFPELANESAVMFAWSTLSMLNAGKWFFKNRPFYNTPPMSRSDKKWAKAQTICKLSDFLNLANQENKMVIFDLHRPPEGHPHRDTWIQKTLDVLLTETKIKPHLVLWLENTDRSYVQSVAPGFQQTVRRKAPIEVLQREKIVKLNLNYRKMSSDDIRKYAEANITTNLYVVNEPWLFSLAWCAGAYSVTTDAVHMLSKFEKPFFLMTPQDYMIMWILADVFTGIFISLVFLLHWSREKVASCCSGNCADTLASGPYSTFSTDLNAMSGLPTVA